MKRIAGTLRDHKSNQPMAQRAETQMANDEGGMITPSEYDYWKLIYRELVLLPDWEGLSSVSRAHKLLERIEEKLLEADAPPQRKTLFTCSPEEKLKTAQKMIRYFEDEDKH